MKQLHYDRFQAPLALTYSGPRCTSGRDRNRPNTRCRMENILLASSRSFEMNW